MSNGTPEKKDIRNRMKALREERKDILSRNRDILKNQTKEISLLKKEMKKGAYTIPALASATGLKNDKVLWYVYAMKKYGIVEEIGEVGGYFKYILAKSPDVNKEMESEVDVSD